MLPRFLLPRIKVSTVIPAPPDQVWADVSNLASHAEWMRDAAAITFKTRQRDGVGTRFDCLTKIGPLALTDHIEVTEWKTGRVIGVRHRGLVRGTGRFTLRRKGRRATRFTWTERLMFPWWLGGYPAAVVGGQVLRLVWWSNLRALRRRFDAA